MSTGEETVGLSNLGLPRALVSEFLFEIYPNCKVMKVQLKVSDGNIYSR